MPKRDSKIELAPVPLPNFGLPDVDVAIPASTYAERLEELESRYVGRGYDLLVVYGDREHFANLSYLTNYDPRFEEALLILQPGRQPTLLVGNEGMAYATAAAPIELEFVLFQPFSLLSQPRGDSAPFSEALAAAGLGRGQRVASVGWKYYSAGEPAESARWIELPAFIVDTLREFGCTVENATDLLMDPAQGMRAVNDVDQLAAFEAAASFSSQAVRDILFGLRPGFSEYEGIQLARLNGWPISLYPILLSGERTELALASPSHRKLQRGDPVVTCVGLWGGNTCRAGFLAEDARDLPAEAKDYLEKLVIPYFRSAIAWYETIGLGVTGAEVYAAVHRHVGDPFFGVKLNPGHLIHLDEWVSSPISKHSAAVLGSGMALQLDIIPATGTPYWTSNVEDGIALADEGLRSQFAAKYPAAWHRILHRRAFMKDALGISLKPEVLPFSNLPGYLPPFWLSPGMAMRRA
jgi:hypothetical protein